MWNRSQNGGENKKRIKCDTARDLWVWFESVCHFEPTASWLQLDECVCYVYYDFSAMQMQTTR